MQKEIGITPYHDYCLHCDHYRESVEKIGLEYIYDFTGCDKASCSILIYDPKKFPKKLTVNENTLQMHRNASDNEYFHKDFHSSLNNGINYLGERYGEAVLCDYLRTYTHHVYNKVIEDIKTNGVKAITSLIEKTYEAEKAKDVLKITEENGKTIVEIDYCPAVKHLNDTGRKVTKWFSYSTSVVMETLAEFAKVKFTLEFYDENTGKAKYYFS